MNKMIVFDMDGTLADTSPGILNSHRYAHDMMGRSRPSTDVLRSVIGGPLLDTYRSRFIFSETEARAAVQHYRQYYSEKGFLEAELYPDIKEALKELRKNGFYLGVATLKAERFVKKMLENMGIAELFDAIFGMDEADSRTKAQLIEMCMQATGVSKNATTMIGDSIHDFRGAAEIGVKFVGVTYGFGFDSKDTHSGFTLVNTPFELIELLCP
jgi:phosphoglycolate phosphatase